MLPCGDAILIALATAVVVSAVWRHALQRKCQSKTIKFRCDAENEQGEAQPKRQPPSHNYKNYDHPTEEEHRTAEQFNWRNTIYLNGFIAVIAVAAAWFAHATYTETRRQADTASDTEERQLRAYIGIKVPDDGQIIITGILPPAIPIARLGAQDFGITPGYKVLPHYTMNLAPYPLPANYNFPIGDKLPPTPATIFPGAFDPLKMTIVYEPIRPLTAAEAASVANGKERIYIWGTINYVDAFGANRFTNFCYSFFGVTDKTAQYQVCDQHNDAD